MTAGSAGSGRSRSATTINRPCSNRASICSGSTPGRAISMNSAVSVSTISTGGSQHGSAVAWESSKKRWCRRSARSTTRRASAHIKADGLSGDMFAAFPPATYAMWAWGDGHYKMGLNGDQLSRPNMALGEILELPAPADAGNAGGPFRAERLVEGAGALVFGMNEPSQIAASRARRAGGNIGNQAVSDAPSARLWQH